MTTGRTSWPRLAGVFITVAMLALMAVGIVAIRASERAEGTAGLASRQMLFAVAALVVFAVCALVPYQRFGRLAYPLFAVSLLLLVVVFFLRPVRGSYRWIDLGVIKVQPSELAKLALIVLLAWYLRLGDHYRKLSGLTLPFVLTLVPMVLILREPDLGTALLFLPTLYVMLFLAGAKLRHLLGIVLVGTVLMLAPLPRTVGPDVDPAELRDRASLAYWTQTLGQQRVLVSAAPLTVMKHHQVRRIVGWLRQSDPEVLQGHGYHLHHSKVVLGSGMATGRGDWAEGETYFRMLPDDHTDFIFSVIGGQWGFLGCAGVLALYVVMLVFGIEIAATTYDPFGRLLAAGVLGLMVSQIVINVGMTVGLMPITGMTLPMVSYGGTSLLVNAAAMGLLVNVGQRRPIYLSRRPFEHDEDTSHLPYRPLENLPFSGQEGSRQQGTGKRQKAKGTRQTTTRNRTCSSAVER
jgi:rod shape determining protein RodA